MTKLTTDTALYTVIDRDSGERFTSTDFGSLDRAWRRRKTEETDPGVR